MDRLLGVPLLRADAKMLTLTRPRYAARIASDAADIRAAQMLRALAFKVGTNTDGTDPDDIGPDQDSFDASCTHFLIEDRAQGGVGRVVCCFRVLLLAGGSELGQSYSAQFYDLQGLGGFAAPMLELGRFCIHPQAHDPDILRVAWAALTRYVDRQDVRLMFGCSSFCGLAADRYTDAFDLLRARHLAPDALRPRIKAPQVIRYGEQGEGRVPDRKRGLQQMPPLLRSYLAMGGWVSDHAVIDSRMNTLHVFTGLEIGSIPPARKRLLRAAAQMLDGIAPAG